MTRSTADATATATVNHPARPAFVTMLLAETRSEWLKAVRQPGFLIPSLFFPVGFFTLFGTLIVGPRNGPDVTAHMLATFGVFGAIGPALFGFGVGIANEREQGSLNIKRASPAPTSVILGARLLMAMAFSFVISLMLFGVAWGLGNVRLAPSDWAGLLLVNLVTAAPFGLMGLAIGLRTRAQSAAAVTNVIFLLMSVLGGLWMPVSVFPEFMQKLAHIMPTFHMGRLALAQIGQADLGAALSSLIVIGAFGLVCGGLAARAWRHLDSDR